MTPDPTRSAQERMTAAKELFTRASIATLQGSPVAVALTQAALIELDEAQAELRLAEDTVPVA